MDELKLHPVDITADGHADDESAAHAARSSPETQDKPVIVGLDGREHDADALALGRSLQSALGGKLLLAHVVPPAILGRAMREHESLERREGIELLARAAENLGDGAETELVDSCPPARGLSRMAAEHHASMLVLGSSHRGAVGRIVPGGVASHLLAGASCPIAVAPVGYAQRAPSSVPRLAVAYDRTRDSDRALATAASAATRLGGSLRLYHAMHSVSKGSASDGFRASMQDFAHGILDAGLSRVPPELQATSTVLEGDIAAVVADAAMTTKSTCSAPW